MAAPALTARAYVTLDEFYAMSDLPDGAELVDGEVVVTPPPSHGHNLLARALFRTMDAHAIAWRLGECFGDGAGYELPLPGRPHVFRTPDASFVRADRMPRSPAPSRALPLAPDVAVEVRSPSDVPAVLAAKLRDYLEAGTAAVWVVDGEARTLTIHAPGAPPRLLREADTLEGGDAFPGFALPLAQLFAALDD